MKKIIFILCLFFCINEATSKTVYVYTNDIAGLVAKIRVNEGNDVIAELSKNQWTKFSFSSKKTLSLTFKCANYFSKKEVNINFVNKDVAFIRVELGDMGWDVYEQFYPNVPAVVWNDYSTFKNEVLLKNRIANHPKTEWTEQKLKQRFSENIDEIEGIYENSFSSTNSPRYKVGVIKENGMYKLIYLSGGDKEIWTEGDIKAILTATATAYLFKAQWYMGDKSQNDEVFITFKQGGLSIIVGDGAEQVYVKLFPTSEAINSTTVSTGTGFALSEDGYIVTNYHVVESGKHIMVKGINGDFNKTYSVQIISQDKNNDLAILKIIDSSFTSINNIPYKLNLKVIDVGSSVFALGYPLISTMGDEIKLTNGIISSKSGFQGDITTYQISVPVQPGNSGGPLFDNRGNIVGIINAKHANTDNVSYAIKTLYLYNLIQSIENPPSELNRNTIENNSLSEQVKKVKDHVYIIEVSN